MNRKAATILLACTFALAPIALFGSTFAAWAVTDNADPFGLRVMIADNAKTVTFYTSYENSAWVEGSHQLVIDGGTVESVPSVSLSGYTFKGWIENEPTSSNYDTGRKTSQQVAALAITSNKTFYPVFESNYDYAYTNSTYYQADVDVDINTDSIGSTTLGKRYVGIDGIPSPTATWDNSRSLYSASGKYKFQNVDGGAMLYRKVGFKANSNWNGSWDGSPCFGIYAWDDSGSVSVHMGYGTTVYGYIPATYINFKFSRYSHNATSFTWGNESDNLSFDNSWWWNGQSNNKYTSSTYILSMNSWSSWVNNWASDKATWVS